LVVYLVALGVGSAWATRRRTADDVRGDLALAHALFAVGLLAALYAVNRLPYWYVALNAAWPPKTLAGVVGLELVILGSVLFVPVLGAGTILPLALIAAVPAGARGTGGAVGRVYAVNTVGAIIGALLAGFVLVPFLGTQTTLVLVCLCAAGLAVACAGASGRWGWKASTAAAAALLVVAGAAFRPAWDYLALHAGV